MKYIDTVSTSLSVKKSSTSFIGSCLRAFVFLIAFGLAGAIALPQSAAAQCQSNGTGGGDWSSGSTWTGCSGTGGLPGASDNVSIEQGDDVTLDVSTTVNGLTLVQGFTANPTLLTFDSNDLNVTGDVTLNDNTTLGLESKNYGFGTVGGGNIDISGDLTSTGTLDGATDPNAGTVILSGSTQAVDVSNTIQRLETAAGLTLTLGADLTVTDLIANGSSNTSGLTLADGSGSGAELTIDGSNTDVQGEISVGSNVTVESNVALSIGGNVDVNGTLNGNGNDITASGDEFFISSGGSVDLGDAGGATLTLNAADLINEGGIDLRGSSVIANGGNVSNTNANGWTDGATSGGIDSDLIFRNSPGSGQDINFTEDSVANLTIEGTAEVSISGASQDAVTLFVDESLFVAVGGQLGEGDPSKIGNPLEEENEEDSDIRFGGRSLVVDSGPGVDDKGYLFANSVTFNAENNANGDALATDDLVEAEGEIFARTEITNATFVGLERTLTVNELLGVSSNNSVLQITASGGELRLNDDITLGSSAEFNAAGEKVTFVGGTYPVDNNGDPNCPTEGTTDNGTCTQDIRGSGSYNFGPIEIDATSNPSAQTRVRVIGQEGNLEASNVTIDPQNSGDPGKFDDPNTALELDGADATLTGSLINNGLFIPGGGLVTFDSASENEISTTTDLTFADIKVDNRSGNGFSITSSNSSSVFVDGYLELVEGEITTNGLLTLNSDASIVYGEGTVDDLLAKRMLAGSNEWYLVSNPMVSSGSPVVEKTYDEFLRQGDERLWVQGPTGSDAPGATGTDRTLFEYDPTLVTTTPLNKQEGWTEVPNMSNPASVGDGMFVFNFGGFNRGTGNIEVRGTPRFPKDTPSESNPDFDWADTDDYTPGLQDGTTDDQDGWNLLGNPYMTYIEWGPIASTGERIDAVAYVWNANTQGYDTSNGTTGSDFDFIAPFQAFFVQARGSNPALQITDITTVQKSDGPDSNIGFGFRSTTNDERALRLNLEMEGIETNTSVSFLTEGTTDKDRWDAYYLRNSFSFGSLLEMYTTLPD